MWGPIHKCQAPATSSERGSVDQQIRASDEVIVFHVLFDHHDLDQVCGRKNVSPSTCLNDDKTVLHPDAGGDEVTLVAFVEDRYDKHSPCQLNKLDLGLHTCVSKSSLKIVAEPPVSCCLVQCELGCSRPERDSCWLVEAVERAVCQSRQMDRVLRIQARKAGDLALRSPLVYAGPFFVIRVNSETADTGSIIP